MDYEGFLHMESSWAGCTTTLLSNFPYDQENPWNEEKLNELREVLKKSLPKIHPYTRSWLVTLCSQQLKAKAILEEAGFKVLIETESGHPETPGSKQCNGGRVYLMWKEVPKEKK